MLSLNAGATQAQIRATATQAQVDSLLIEVESLTSLVSAKDDTLGGLQWLLEQERVDNALALDFCEQKADSLDISLVWAQRWLDDGRAQKEPEPFWKALGSKPVVFVAGIVFGAWTTVQVMDAVN